MVRSYKFERDLVVQVYKQPRRLRQEDCKFKSCWDTELVQSHLGPINDMAGKLAQ